MGRRGGQPRSKECRRFRIFEFYTGNCCNSKRRRPFYRGASNGRGGLVRPPRARRVRTRASFDQHLAGIGGKREKIDLIGRAAMTIESKRSTPADDDGREPEPDEA